jgi:hypothetical protein
MKTVIVTAIDSDYFELAKGLLLSIREKPQGADMPVAVLDVGLDDWQLAWIRELPVTRIVQPEWDIQFPDVDRQKSGFKAMVARPFLPVHVPGYDLYQWIDSDAWVQDWSAIDRSYSYFYDKSLARKWMFECYEKAYGRGVAQELGLYPIVNSGVFAMRADAGLWTVWRESLKTALVRTTDFYVEQTAFNHAIYTGKQPLHLLPSTCNWHCGFAPPKLDAESGELVEPFLPYARLGIVHLCGGRAKKPIVPTFDTQGAPRDLNLRYKAGRY